MTKTTTPPTPIHGLVRSSAPSAEYLHFTGGLLAEKGPVGWRVGPILRDGSLISISGIPDEKLGPLAASAGLTLFGADQVIAVDPNLITRIWRPLLGPPRLAQAASETWGMIASSSQTASDENYARLSRNLSISLRAAGIQLRNASDEYNRQLIAALKRNDSIGQRFSNLSMDDLHFAFHSTVTEMTSCRDYLAQVAARRVGAPARIDALNRLKDWVEKPANATAQNDVLVQRLMKASDPIDADPWLADITEYRNLFLHREHMGAIAEWLVLERRESDVGPVRIVSMLIEIRPEAKTTCDALSRFVDLYNRLCRLADFAGTLAAHPATLPTFVAIS